MTAAITRSPEAPVVALVVFHDPDGIPIELFWGRTLT